jgi:metal-responsive CopG/Arc/MetJ family transcriptional regulator
MSTVTTMQRIIVTMPPSLLTQVEEVAAKLNFSRSRLIREALEQYVEAQRRQELRELLKEGYVINAERDLRICEEFAAADYEAMARHVPPYEGGQKP